MTPVALHEDAVAQVNAACPDLVLLTGDFVTRSPVGLPALQRTLSRIEAPAIAVLGNHDHWVGGARVRGALEAAGVTVLSNSATILGEGEDRFAIVGLDDYGSGKHDADAATRTTRGIPCLGLSHNPEAAPLLWERGVPLVLSGHTHGGQIQVGGLTRHFYERVLGKRFLGGWYAEGGRHVYVNPGVGSSVFPFRSGSGRRTFAVLDIVEATPRPPPLTRPASSTQAHP
jgi:hypothetical protein